MFPSPPAQVSRPRDETVHHVEVAWPETMRVRYVTDQLGSSTLKVDVIRGQDIAKELANMWSTGKFLHLSCHNNGFDLFSGHCVKELTNPAELERAREALANSVGKSNKKDRAEAAAILYGLNRRSCDLAGLATFRFSALACTARWAAPNPRLPLNPALVHLLGWPPPESQTVLRPPPFPALVAQRDSSNVTAVVNEVVQTI